MKWMFISDIHGSLHWLNHTLEKAIIEQPDQLILLGDYMYHGPRNPLPEGYDPAGVADALNAHKHQIIGIRGNCDAEVDQMLLQFPMMGDYVQLYNGTRRIYATHGHGYSIDNLPDLRPGDIFIQGHTHIPVADIENDIYILNPGSIALPKQNFPHSYGILDHDSFTIKDFEGNTIKSIVFQ